MFDPNDFLDDDALAAFIADTAHQEEPSVPEGVECQICNAPLATLSDSARQAHYEQHFSDGDEDGDISSLVEFEADAPVAGHSRDPMVNSRLASSFQRLRSGFGREKELGDDYEPSPSQNVFWRPGLDNTPPDSFTAGLIPLLKTALEKTHAKSTTRQAFLCSDLVCHVATERWDMGWGCGYRNFLMACTALMAQQQQPEYAKLLSEPYQPGVRNLQRWIQQAWADGFDEEGKRELKHLVGTRRWIGTGELFTAFTYRGVPAKLIDFPTANPRLVLQWVKDYFDPPTDKSITANALDALRGGGSAIVVTGKMPLVLQHAGHSRTIIGIEINRLGEMNLLLFDPSKKPARQIREAGLAAHLKVQLPHRKRDVFTKPLKHVLNPLSNTGKRARSSSGDGSLNMSVVGAKLVDGGGEADANAADGAQRSAKKARIDERSSPPTRPPPPPKDENAPMGAAVPSTHTRAASLALRETQLDPLRLVKLFRLNTAKLGKNDKYQILYFPMTAPYDDEKRWAHRDVTSRQIK
ncbi:peptidase family C78-domain-containing protein [Auriculariales sp. MPI-PUGE-AT-0066]|nr:peptidase family C78-domain-containing protein [Auriculariales sp. MPI-PUGE-AT-0066]